jgi:hypothetical protein
LYVSKTVSIYILKLLNMIIFEKQIIEGLDDFDSAKTFSNMRFENCEFIGCMFSSTMDFKLRSIARNIEFKNCSARGVGIGPGIIEDVLIDGLKVHGHLQTEGAVFKHVTVRGSVNRLMITPYYDLYGRFPEVRRSFDNANAEYYEKIDWALDISEAKFNDCDIRGIPAKLIIRDNETQVVIKRQKVADGEWMKLDLSKTHWDTSISHFLDSQDEDCVLVAPKRNRKFKELLNGLKLLREAGFAESD